MRILLFGKSGQVGWELQRSLMPLAELLALDRHVEGGDLGNLGAMSRRIVDFHPDVIVNAAAYTAVDRAEDDEVLCHKINATAPAVMAQHARDLGALLVHYSTDYVFDGSGETPWLENDPVGPLNVYGRTKLEGERSIINSGCNYLIFRTSWVYGVYGENFAKMMLRLAGEREELRVVNDQVGAPTGADLLADVTAHAIKATLADTSFVGLYHLAATGETTWHGYATYCIDCARDAGAAVRVPSDKVLPVTTSAFPTPARRPNNSRLNTSRLQQQFDIHLPPWQLGVRRMLVNVLGNKV